MRAKAHRPIVAALLVLMLAACAGDDAPLPPPREPDANSIGYFCNMSLPEHAGPRGQAFLKGRDAPYWFASIGEAFVFLETALFQPKDLLVLYVSDMSKGTWEHPAPGAWIDIRDGIFVLGSSRTAAMGGKEAVPFSSREAAESFVTQYGGEIADFAAAKKALAVEAHEGT